MPTSTRFQAIPIVIPNGTAVSTPVDINGLSIIRISQDNANVLGTSFLIEFSYDATNYFVASTSSGARFTIGITTNAAREYIIPNTNDMSARFVRLRTVDGSSVDVVQAADRNFRLICVTTAG